MNAETQRRRENKGKSKKNLFSVGFSAPLRLCVPFLFLTTTIALAGFFYNDGATTMHFAFEGNPNGDWPVVRAPGNYHKDDGFGFVDSPDLIGATLGVTAPKYFRFDVNIPNGDYDVTVMCGGADEDGMFTIEAQDQLPMAKNVKIAAGDTATGTFTVHVGPDPTGKDTGPLSTDSRLHLEFTGTNPSMMKLDIAPHKAKNG